MSEKKSFEKLLAQSIWFGDPVTASAALLSRRLGSEGCLEKEKKSWSRVVVVSPRLPFKVVDAPEGRRLQPNDGGLVNALLPILKNGTRAKWVGWHGSTEPGSSLEGESNHANYEVSSVLLTKEEEERYYRGFFHEVLNPISLGRVDQVNSEDAEKNWHVYQQVQRKFAEKIRDDVGPGDIIWVHEYHLAGVSKELRALGVTQPTGYFLHMPFPELEHFSALPHREEFIDYLLAYDILGFQTPTFVARFLQAVEAYAPEALIERSEKGATVFVGGRTVRVDYFPASIDAGEFAIERDSSGVRERVQEITTTLKKGGSVKLMFNAGRLEYTKGFYEELLAFDRMLEEHPEMVGTVVLAQLVIPCRESTASYGAYKERIVELAERINEKHRGEIAGEEKGAGNAYDGMPVRQMHAHMDRALYTAYLNAADVQTVPTLADGMNLVAKEGAIAGNPEMVQILGEAAGAVDELGRFSIVVNPQDTDALAHSMHQALTMDTEEKRLRKQGMSDVVASHSVYDWWSKGLSPMFQTVWDERASRQHSEQIN